LRDPGNTNQRRFWRDKHEPSRFATRTGGDAGRLAYGADRGAAAGAGDYGAGTAAKFRRPRRKDQPGGRQHHHLDRGRTRHRADADGARRLALRGFLQAVSRPNARERPAAPLAGNHVIDKADEIDIEFFSGEKLSAKVVGTDPKTDIALLKVEPRKPLPFVRFGDSDTARVGDWVLAMGNPLGQGFSLSAGIVSARNRALSGTYDDYIQTDAAINRGNSGGPLFNMAGDVVGVNTAILSPTGGSIGIGFSMASNVVKRVVDQLKEFGETRRGWLGVRIQDVTDDVAEAMGLEKVAGALVTDVPEGPAAEAGMQAGDVILSFDGREVEDTRALVRQVGNTAVGKTVRVVVYRDGKTRTLKVTLGRREVAEGAIPVAQPGAPEGPQEKIMMGLTMQPLDDELRAQLDLGADATGLVVTDVDELSEAYEKGLRAGDVITEAGQRKVTSIPDLEARIAEAREAGRKSLLLLVRRAGEPRFVALNIGK
jgi:serine protease Do